ncbi:MAG: glycosyltransferase family 1 protein [Hymenobacter sp.]|nr:MAG: glycosyltransferase family 1 protein [Hymenobacter sp.]
MGQRPKVLWAGRLDRQKRPDILRDVALMMPEINFVVYGAAMLDTSCEKSIYNELCAIKNIDLRGEFDGFSSISREDFELLLYTSGWDGLPNIILESFSAGLPVLASNVGGISEAYPNNSQFLISNAGDPSAYVLALRNILNSSTAVQNERERILRYCRAERTFDQFAQRIADVKNYSLSVTPSRSWRANYEGNGIR